MVNMVPTALQTPWSQKAKILPASALGLVSVAIGGYINLQTAPSKICAVIACNNDTVSHDIKVGILDTVVGFTPLGTVTVPINAGYIGTVPSVNLLANIAALPLDETGQAFIFLNPTDIIQVRCQIAAVSTGMEVDIEVQGADF